MAIAKKKPAAKKKWMQKAAASMKRRKTEGSFTKWCKAHGYGSVTAQCIAAGLKAGGAIAKKAQFAKAVKSRK